MRHFFKTKLLVSSCALLLAATNVSAADEDTIQMGSKSHNKQSLSSGNMNVIKSFRTFYRNHSDGSEADKSLVEHQDIFLPFAKFLLETMGRQKQTPFLEELQSEVHVAIARKRVSPDWLIDMHFRFLALDGMSESERDVFNHVPYHKYLNALLAKDIQGNPVVVDLYKWGTSLDREGEYFYTSGEDTPYIQGISGKASDLIDEAIAKCLPAPIVYPSLGEGILPITLIIRNWFKEIYHIGMPTENVKDVHGEENTSKLGFAFHDLFHYKNDKRRHSLDFYIKSKLSPFVMQGLGFASDVIPKLVPLAVQKYSLIMAALEKAYLGVEEDKHAVAGYFTLAHEVSPFTKEIFDFSSPMDLIDDLVKKVLAYYAEPDVWENSEDPLHTSLNGSSTLSDEAIKELALARLATDGSLNLPYQIYEKRGEQGEYIGWATEEVEKAEIRKAWLPKNTRSEVKKTAQFIDVKFTFMDGEEKTISYPTLNRKWKNVNASLGLLSFAGIKLEKPNLNGLDQNQDREDAIKFIELVRSKLEGTVTDFAQKAKAIFGESAVTGSSTSTSTSSGSTSGTFAQDYEAQMKSLDDQILELVGVG